MCVQNFDDSRGPAIRITYRISLRSSSLWDPRHPLPKVVRCWFCQGRRSSVAVRFVSQFCEVVGGTARRGSGRRLGCVVVLGGNGTWQHRDNVCQLRAALRGTVRFGRCDNDPSAGSPTETLLRLHLPLNDKVQTSFYRHLAMKQS